MVKDVKGDQPEKDGLLKNLEFSPISSDLRESLREISQLLQLEERNKIELTLSNDENLLGKGGYGEVSKGTLKVNDELKNVAIKQSLKPFTKEFMRTNKQFLKEINLLDKLDHPHVVKVIRKFYHIEQSEEEEVKYEV